METTVAYQADNDNPEERKRFVRRMFDSIVPTYDLLNHLLSLGADVRWRKDLARRAVAHEGDLVIDLCCGTGDVSKLLNRLGAKTVSLDFSGEMLKRGVKKKALAGDAVMGDACVLPFMSDTFDAATIAFGIRNLPDLGRFITEVHRVLKNGGKLTILELVRPESRMVRLGYFFYLRKVLPVIGGIMSGKPLAYRYLAGTITTFFSPHVIQEMLEKHGFAGVSHYPRTFGVATVITCVKEPR